ncbi:MAG: bifunctional DNA primase/polymerase [Nitrososphaeraceae archaeon]
MHCYCCRPCVLWPELLDIGIIQAHTKTKTVDLKGWPTLDFTKVDFKANLANGLYDHGIALRTGKTISGNNYLVVLDFDGWEAVIAWFGSWDNVLALSRKTLVEWHQDQGKIHVFLFSPEPLLSRKIHIKNAYLEIRCQNEEGMGQLVFASPSIHKEGLPYCALGIGSIEEMQTIDLLRIKSKMNQLCENCMSDLDKDEYDAMLDDPGLILGVDCGRHDATLFKAIRYYFKYSGDWLDLSDEQRFERAWQWHLAHCKPPRSRKEFEEICKWIVATLRQKRDQLHDAERLKRNNSRSQRQQGQQQRPEASAEEADKKKPPEPKQNYKSVQFYQEGNIFAEAVTIGNSRTQRFAAVNT